MDTLTETQSHLTKAEVQQMIAQEMRRISGKRVADGAAVSLNEFTIAFAEINARFQDQKEYMEKRFQDQKEYTEKRFQDQKEYMDTRFEQIEKRFSALGYLIAGGFAFLSLLIGYFGFLAS